MKFLFTTAFALLSVAFTFYATDSVSAACAVLFGLWAIAGIVEMGSGL